MTHMITIVVLLTCSQTLYAVPQNEDAKIAAKFDELNKLINELGYNKYLNDVAVYQKAARWMIRHHEYEDKDAKNNLLKVLNIGLGRAKALKENKTPWLDVRGKPIIRGDFSIVDLTVQPYAITLPLEESRKDKSFPVEIVLHGRSKSSSEVKFIMQHEEQKADLNLDRIIIEPFGRGNLAYRWAAEEDVTSKLVIDTEDIPQWKGQMSGKKILRGFSMGGAGVWHIGLHYPYYWSVIGPGAGFTNTHGYIKNLPEKLSDYQEQCLTIYDAVRYAENAYNIPVVAYSGANDPQKQAADNIVSALKGVQLPMMFEHLVAPGLEHKMPPEWLAKARIAYDKAMAQKRPPRIRFVTYTTRYNSDLIYALEKMYEKATIDIDHKDSAITVSTNNIRGFTWLRSDGVITSTTIDQQKVAIPTDRERGYYNFEKRDGKWTCVELFDQGYKLTKHNVTYWQDASSLTPDIFYYVKRPQQGPIDDAFMSEFVVVKSSRKAWHPDVSRFASDRLDAFDLLWEKYFRGSLEYRGNAASHENSNIVLFGDPGSNPDIAKIVDKLPITWSEDELIVNGVKYDPKTHMPMLIYPHPYNKHGSGYVVINSGHTFTEADLRGTNANLYPHLGDWAVIKIGEKPEVVAAGLFDEFWQFKK